MSEGRLSGDRPEGKNGKAPNHRPEPMTAGRNRIPENVQKIHLIGACGTGMGALACMLKDRGHDVTGSDENVYPPMSDFLARKNIPVTNAYSPRNLSPAPDLVVVGNTVRKDNPEARELRRLGLFFCSMPQAVSHFMAAGKTSIVAAGSHGKTTTSSLAAWILHEAGLDPSFMIGGILGNFDSNHRDGKGPHIVIEGDEYDTAFFDKGSKFLHYAPDIAILTSVEFDHADIFTDLDHVMAAFDAFISILPPDGTLLAFDGDENIARLLAGRDRPSELYGLKRRSPWSLGRFSPGPGKSSFSVFRHGEFFGDFRIPMVGRHNMLNALAAIAAAHLLGVPRRIIKSALAAFKGVKRRQEIRGVKNGVTVIDDFAHHPTAVRETVDGVKSAYPGRRLIAVFEPRTHSSRRNVFQSHYPLSFDRADVVCVRKPPFLDTLPEKIRFSSQKLVSDLQKRQKEAFYFSNADAIVDFIAAGARPGDIALVMSNGGFERIHEKLLDRL
ncbi:UDP-N-acetylmuramate--L-alanyl-gamma-D-glutamyl-meso-2,6-diaminoheptandioate ligase [Candidatus Desulfarcum epimagneticum]|uniref:UDP-N-acetylmuramate--L-alanyl-gamma-D-glutamyl-meso-2,6-diaminoheptandioate ligase n=1 Tax=uncultured Desulfobacteraceae bacterium TaxID=218296 RepID=A0A484HIS3_9BACT|nr:UDP-N-acetylmuramate--L-alanyl-gamma-D-glutamyl-meso-2,6-diaminoheptandioate ligase [uncultured Desulfobacteraceae bacterium]